MRPLRAEASPGSRARLPFTGPQRVLLAGSFLITLGSFAVLPYVSVLLHQRLGIALGTVGLVLAVASLIQFAGGVVAGPVVARLGLRRAMLLALALRTAGFAAFVPGLRSPVLAVGALLLVSAGAALYLPANKAYLVEGVAEAGRPRLLSASSSAFNAGMALGPPAAAPLVMGSPGVLFSCVTGLFALIGAGHALLPHVGADRQSGGAGSAAAEARDTGERASGFSPFLVTVLSVYAFMFFQHYLALYAVPRTSAAFYGAVLTGYAVLLVVAQPLLAERIGSMSYPAALRWGFGAMAAGTAAIGVGGHAGIAVGGALLCLGEIVLFLKNDLEALARSPSAPASVFGRQRLAAGIGAFASGVVGGQLYGAAEAAGSARAFWAVVCLQCVLLPSALLLRRRAVRGRTARGRAGPRAEGA
ncbi:MULTISPECIES: MFS transporter [Streptomyces]|uniref:MFS transporter n=1 Tax=Streptomyces TaxID=1883 RepID=UPI001673B63D|nr:MULTISPECIES: MFS transporter [Streptomyces]WGP08867.1 MFS transporter [Streptomyces sp. SH5]